MAPIQGQLVSCRVANFFAVRIGSRIEVISDGKMTVIAADAAAAALGRPADTSAEDNLKTFALVEAVYEKAGKVNPARLVI